MQWSFQHLGGAAGHPAFVSTFCGTDTYGTIFQNVLGGFTPCFCDIVLLGATQLMLAAFSLLRISQLRSQSRPARICGWRFSSHRAAVVVAGLCALIPWAQLSARLAQPETPVAPFEYVGFALGICSYAAACWAIVEELRAYVPMHTWLLRMPLVAAFAAQLSKMRSVFLHIPAEEERGYFFGLFLALVLLQGALAMWAVILAYPDSSTLDMPDCMDVRWPLLPSPSTHLILDLVSGKERCPEEAAGLWDLVTFSWLNPLLEKGHQAALQMQDIWAPPPGDMAEDVGALFGEHWRKELELQRSPSLLLVCWKTVARLFLAAVPFKLGNDASQFVAPVFLNLLLTAIAAKAPPSRSYQLAGLMLLGLIGGCICEAQYFQRTMRAGFRLRAALVAAVHRKVMFLTASARARHSRGFIYNLVTTDADSVQLMCNQAFTLISSPVRIVVAMCLLYGQLGSAAFAALVLLVCLLPIQMWLANWSARILREGMVITDERTKLESDVVTGVEAVKTMAWEAFFSRRVREVRGRELAVLWRGFVLAAANALLLQTIPTFVTIATFSMYVLLGNDLTATKAFTALSLFAVLRNPLFQLPMVITQATRAAVAFNRLRDFLASEEQGQLAALPRATGPQGRAARFDGTVSWAPDVPPTLSDVRFVARNGQLVIIVGATGSGKTSLLCALLGLTEHVEGNTAALRGAVAYVSNAAFIFGGTIQENIVFSAGWSAERYERALEAAALHEDLEQLPAGDETELGEGGVNISGGQKQRIQIARAVYADADVILLDDPLSALDARVGRAVFERAIVGEMADRTRLLVTNQLQYVPHADLVVVLRDGRIAESGGYEELMARGGILADMMATVRADSDSERGGQSESRRVDGELKRASSGASIPRRPSEHHILPARGTSSALPGAQRSGRLTENEGREKGVVSFKVLGAYVHAMGGVSPFLWLVGAYIAVEALRVSSSVWLSVWTSGDGGSGRPVGPATPPGPTPPPEHTLSPKFFLAIFCTISLGQVAVSAVAQFRMRALSIRAADGMHTGMFQCLLHAPMSFFHINPPGRIVNRLTKDTSDIDRNLAFYAALWFQSTLTLLTTAIVVGTVTPFALPFIVPMVLIFGLLYLYFQDSVREVKRLDSLARSPIFTAVGNVITGLPTIRSYRREGALVQRTAGLIDDSSAMQLCNQSLNRWLSLRLEAVGALVAFAAAALAIEQKGEAAWSGLTLSYALQITGLTTMALRLASMAENSFNAVERVDEFSHVSPEGADGDARAPPAAFPPAGEIAFSDVSLRYRPGLPLVLKDLTFTIPAATRVGVVGRTGAGKSTVINALFRLQELAGGSILIDGIDTRGLEIGRLRASMALIPQTPVLFAGTLRSNIAPTGEHCDADIWGALEGAHLAALVRTAPDGLDLRLSEGGAPLAAGQRQLVALARALLKHSRILVLDEATANVDMGTDSLIQDTIRTRFAGATVVAVAHRLQTIIDYDRVLVVDKGTAGEFDTPAALLAKQGGIFASMVAETGPATARHLRDVATGALSLEEERTTAAEQAREHAERAVERTQGFDGVRMAEGLARDADDAAGQLTSLLLLLEDQEQTERMLERFGAGGLPMPDNEPDSRRAAEVATALRNVAQAVATVQKGLRKLHSMAALRPSEQPPSPPEQHESHAANGDDRQASGAAELPLSLPAMSHDRRGVSADFTMGTPSGIQNGQARFRGIAMRVTSMRNAVKRLQRKDVLGADEHESVTQHFM